MDYFEVIESDSFHIRPFDYLQSNPLSTEKFKQFKGKPVPRSHSELTSLESALSPDKFFANEAIKIDSNHFAGMLVVQDKDVYRSVVLILILNKKGKMISFFQAASWTHLEGTMEETQNAWIFDEDLDGDLDIVVMSDLVDYELPTEDAPNISGVTALTYRNLLGSFETVNISDELWYKLSVQK
ncbi:MAG: hypothetical protein ABJG68_14195 [Crocinitomicaceae bacterium]